MSAISRKVYSGPYLADGVQVAFPFDFSIVTTSELSVLINGATVSAARYSVAAFDEGGTITFSAPPLAGSVVLLCSDPDFTAASAFTNQGAYNLSTINQINRRAAARDLWLRDGITRALQTPVGELPLDLPAAFVRANSFLGFDANGDPIAMPGTGSPDLSGIQVSIVGNSQVQFTITGTDGVVRTAKLDLETADAILFRRPIWGWTQRAGLGGYRFVTFEPLSSTTGIVSYSARSGATDDDEVGYRLEVAPYTLDVASRQFVVGTPTIIATPAQFASGLGAYWNLGTLRLPTGRILLFGMYLNAASGSYNAPDARYDVVQWYSDNDGGTWTRVGTIVPGENAHILFGTPDINAAGAGWHIVNGINNMVRMPGGRLVLLGYLYPGYYLASLYTDDPGGITGWTFGAALPYPSNDYNEPSLAIAGSTLIATVRRESVPGRAVYRSIDGGASWAFDRFAADVPIRNVAGAMAADGRRVIVGGATTAGDNRKGWDMFVSDDAAASFPLRSSRLFDRLQRIGYACLKRIAPGFWGMPYEVTSTQAPGSFNKENSIGMLVFNDAALTNGVQPTRANDALLYNAAAEYASYAAYVAADGGAIADPAACQAAIAAAIAGNYYSGIGFAVSARWGHKALGDNSSGATAQAGVLYSLNRRKSTSAGAGAAIFVDSTAGYPVLRFAALSKATFPATTLRAGDKMGAVLVDAALNTSAAASIGIDWVDGVPHYLDAGAGFTVGTTSYLRGSPVYAMGPLDVGHFVLDCEAAEVLHGKNGVDLQQSGYFPRHSPSGKTADINIRPGGGADRLVPELWFFNDADTAGIRRCGADVATRYPRT